MIGIATARPVRGWGSLFNERKNARPRQTFSKVFCGVRSDRSRHVVSVDRRVALDRAKTNPRARYLCGNHCRGNAWLVVVHRVDSAPPSILISIRTFWQKNAILLPISYQAQLPQSKPQNLARDVAVNSVAASFGSMKQRTPSKTNL
jgi:hypothetical protein